MDQVKSDVVDMSVVKGKRVGELNYIAREHLISVTNIINKERVKVWTGKTKGLMQVLWEHIFTDTSKDVCTY